LCVTLNETAELLFAFFCAGPLCNDWKQRDKEHHYISCFLTFGRLKLVILIAKSLPALP
jgi:hypothetical protein